MIMISTRLVFVDEICELGIRGFLSLMVKFFSNVSISVVEIRFFISVVESW
jgi:hypothetical protein